MSERNFVVLVDEHDNVLGVEDKISAHEKALLHRAFSVMLYRYNKSKNKIELLLQQRATTKYHCPDLWTNTCCSHPQQDEDLIDSALKRLKEELLDIDISNLNLHILGDFIYKAEFDNGLTEHEFDHVLIGEYNTMPGYVNDNEVQNLQWFGIAELEQFYSNNINKFTPWFTQVFDMVKIKLSN